MENLDKLLNGYKTLKREATKSIIELFKDVLKDFFEKNPSVDSIGTPMFTPWFNDGDPCKFGVHDDPYCCVINNESMWGDSGTDENYKIANDFCRIINKIPDEIFEDSFEEGLVTFYRDGSIKVLDYDHE